jgi:hypothetical protein
MFQIVGSRAQNLFVRTRMKCSLCNKRPLATTASVMTTKPVIIPLACPRPEHLSLSTLAKLMVAQMVVLMYFPVPQAQDI